MGQSLNKQCKLFPEIKEMRLLEEKNTFSLYETKQKTIVEFSMYESNDMKFKSEIQLIEDLKNYQGVAKIVNYKIDNEEVMGILGGKRLCVLTEIPKYTLNSYLESNQKLDQQQIVDLAAAIILTQCQFGTKKQYLGFNNIYTDDGKIWKLKLFQETRSFIKDFPKQFQNPSGFPAPEEFQKKVTDINRVIIFGFGLIITQLILQQPSSSIYPKGKFDQQVLQSRVKLLKEKSQQYPGKFIEIVISMIDSDLTVRPNFQQLMDLLHPAKSQIKSVILSQYEKIKIPDEIQPSDLTTTSSIVSSINKSQIQQKLIEAAEQSKIKLRNFSQTQIYNCLDGNQYKGQMKDGKFDGEGEITSKDGKTIYIGGFLNGQFNGFGIKTYHDCKLANGKINYRKLQLNLVYVEKYEGFFQNGQKFGEGKLYFTNGEVFLGEFQKDFPHGYGNFSNQLNQQCNGRWENGEMREVIGVESSIINSMHREIDQLETIISLLDNDIKREVSEIQQKNSNNHQYSIIQGCSEIYYQGDLVDNKMQGRGTTYYQNKKEQYVGEFQQNKFHGRGILYNEKPLIDHEIDLVDIRDVFIKGWWFKFDGQFQNGNKHGYGKLYLTDDSQYQGQFYNDEPVGQGFRKKIDNQYFNEEWKDGILEPNQYLC